MGSGVKRGLLGSLSLSLIEQSTDNRPVSGAGSIEEQPVNIYIESREEIGLVSSCRPILRNHITVRTSSSELFSGLCTLSAHTRTKFKEKSIRFNKSISRNIFYRLFMILSLLNT